MQRATCLVTLNEFKASVPKTVTAAEAMLLIRMHSDNAGQPAVSHLVILKDDSNANDTQERKRLASHYIEKHEDIKRVTINTVFPPGQKLPQKFSEITDKEGNHIFKDDGTSIASSSTMTTQLVQKIKVGDKEYTAEELAKFIDSANGPKK